ncbi:hypothetical protein JDV02_003311 [Purpureocillium takamizusanense]|uniref:Zn(2)-C6 fungal-type domain-containing protein n=1 Tax=Purpureocillium takamizusanense TaxID=2060973 RepID=A0A9Q8QAD9_9HYPO|nr:uncharacterized protein JDV02_003311 [Purpureocillium takamizusanense]UNI16929.1 hypothetical protein JDV02_003311 [Purpureocillium takamizusanense]
MKRRAYRALLPAAQGPDQEAATALPPPKKPRNLRIACEACRGKRVACGGERPKCGPCLKRGGECVYREPIQSPGSEVDALQKERDHLKTKLSGHARLLDQLKNLPEDEALGLLQRLRATSSSDSPNALSEMSGGMHNRLRPSNNLAARAMSPVVDSGLEHELAARHALIYPRLEPLDAGPLKILVESTLFKFRPPRVGQSNSTNSVLAVHPAAPLPLDGKPVHQRVQDPTFFTSAGAPLGPVPPQEYCDPRLSRLQIEFWTRVQIPNELAASLISFYLENDHPIMAMFDADLFLDDLVDHRLTYCSAMLVAALLYLSCQAYTRSDIRSSSFVPGFLDEARTLWRAEQSPDLVGTLAAAERITDPITTIAAAELMALGCQVNGQNELGYEFLNTGRRMAEQIGLINTPPTSPKLQYMNDKPPQWISAASHVAWGTYNWLR